MRSYQRVFFPLDALRFVRICIGEPLYLSCLPTEKPVKVRADFVSLAFRQVVALRASGLMNVSIK